MWITMFTTGHPDDIWKSHESIQLATGWSRKKSAGAFRACRATDLPLGPEQATERSW